MMNTKINAMTAEAAVLNTHVKYSSRNKAVEAIDDQILKRQISNRPSGVCITGCSGAGKTSITKEYIQNYPAVDTGEKLKREVIVVSVPANLSGGVLYKEIIEKLGGYHSKRDRIGELQRKAAMLIESCETKLVILDEAQHLALGQTKKEIATVADELKTLMNLGNVSIVLLGVKEVKQLLLLNDQLRRRFSEQLVLNNWSIDDSNDLKEIVSVIMRLLQNGGLPKQDWMSNRDVLKRIYFASNGTIAHLSKLIAGAVYKVVMDNRKEITVKDLESSFLNKIWKDAYDERNPFSKRFNWNPLVELNEPFSEELL